MKRKINKKTISAGLFLAILCLTIGFAILKTDLSIGGSITSKANSWNIYFENVQVSSGSVTASTPSIDSETKTKVTYSVELNEPGDFYEFTVDAVNKGSMDAMVSTTPSLSGLSDTYKNVIKYTASYEDGTPIKQYDKLVSSTGKVTYKIRVEYKNNISSSDLLTEDISLDLSFKVSYIQADENAHEPVCYKIVTSSNGNWIATFKCDNDGTGRMVQCAYKDGTVCNGGKENVRSTHLCTLNASYANYLYGYCNTSLPDIRVNGGGMGTIRC